MTRFGAFAVVQDINKPSHDFAGRPVEQLIDYDRPHRYEWIENKHLSIEDPNYFQVNVIYTDTEEACGK